MIGAVYGYNSRVIRMDRFARCIVFNMCIYNLSVFRLYRSKLSKDIHFVAMNACDRSSTPRAYV
jgi:hypothetical protein